MLAPVQMIPLLSRNPFTLKKSSSPIIAPLMLHSKHKHLKRAFGVVCPLRQQKLTPITKKLKYVSNCGLAKYFEEDPQVIQPVIFSSLSPSVHHCSPLLSYIVIYCSVLSHIASYIVTYTIPRIASGKKIKGGSPPVYIKEDGTASQMRRRHLSKLCSSAARCTISTAVKAFTF